jgi:hypothetical protein
MVACNSIWTWVFNGNKLTAFIFEKAWLSIAHHFRAALQETPLRICPHIKAAALVAAAGKKSRFTVAVVGEMSKAMVKVDSISLIR